MAGGLIALLDDVAAIAKVAAASVDDVGAAAGRAGAKAAGVVIDDAAVTPSYVTGLSPNRELPIIAKIGIGSLRNKLLILLPAALLIAAFVPFLLTPILMLGGAYLCFEGAEKLVEKLAGHDHGDEAVAITDPAELEARQVSGAIRTDLILSAEIMAITLGELPQENLWTQAAVLALVGLVITLLVYGVVALIVKMDDIGLHMVRTGRGVAVGRMLVAAMPKLLKVLSIVGTAAMLWVGGGIIVHGLATFGLDAPEHLIHVAAEAVARNQGLIKWAITALGSGIVGLVVGLAVVGVLHLIPRKGH